MADSSRARFCANAGMIKSSTTKADPADETGFFKLSHQKRGRIQKLLHAPRKIARRHKLQTDKLGT